MKSNGINRLFSLFRHKASVSRIFRLEAAAVIGLIIAASAMMCSTIAEQKAIASKLVRLHITAESDSETDQALKLKVRDRLLEELGDDLGNLESCGDAVVYFEDSLDKIRTIAKDEIGRQGYDCDVRTSLLVETFPEREYGDITLPAGDYTTLRVTLGSGKGANWWCVMFPPLCSFASTEKADGSYYSFTNREWKTITQKNTEIKIKFKFLELVSSIKGWFK
jgi:stage II sporulation protein R